MSEKYLYNDLIYCDDDLSCEIDDYGGDLWDLYNILKKQGDIEEITQYYVPEHACCYASYEEALQDMCDCGWGIEEVK